ncbi:hypothetical protein BO78DRAFT_390789 [Aspergillus sclerotiicarbonarius CBS 121057]|uniref:Uncharacterized protein n=1 Tax=Aspergillus sclerotiicarbonarius (strain CBS 121057 / IBT 28362) TaxID=1448318 RepID=A0A319E5P2_ASPSB|nr:hypothetical protein BO78DRAFT_390789 [Aspergillus sclerotiicarbonarius CBS 121057]
MAVATTKGARCFVLLCCCAACKEHSKSGPHRAAVPVVAFPEEAKWLGPLSDSANGHWMLQHLNFRRSTDEDWRRGKARYHYLVTMDQDTQEASQSRGWLSLCTVKENAISGTAAG